jgi:hypothetical protein
MTPFAGGGWRAARQAATSAVTLTMFARLSSQVLV